MIGRTHRFHGHASLGYVYRQGKTVRGQQFAIKFAANDRRKTYRAAVVVSKKVHKSAVRRNRIRRRIYETIRQLEPLLTGPHDLVVTVFSEQVADMSYIELFQAIESQLKQAGVIAKRT